jgi:hypothetical protein
MARYRNAPSETLLEGQDLRARLASLTTRFVARRDATMQQFRAMLIYSTDDPRPSDLDYPSYPWFLEDRELPWEEKGRLKPTL